MEHYIIMTFDNCDPSVYGPWPSEEAAQTAKDQHVAKRSEWEEYHCTSIFVTTLNTPGALKPVPA